MKELRDNLHLCPSMKLRDNLHLCPSMKLRDNLHLCPNEIKDYILSFCDGYIRADLKIKNVSVKLKKNIVDIKDNLELSVSYVYNNKYTSYYFINKKNTDFSIGYISKSYSNDDIIINYHWVHICR